MAQLFSRRLDASLGVASTRLKPHGEKPSDVQARSRVKAIGLFSRHLTHRPS